MREKRCSEMTAPTGHLGVLEGEACGGPAVIDEWLEHVDAHMCVAALNQWGTGELI